MANYNLVSNAKFQPFSFERYLQPYQMIGEAYREVENNFATLEEQAEAFRDIANQDINPEAYKLHQDYVSKLNEAVEGLSTRESTPAELRRRMLNMRKEYTQKILPIARASEAMKEANAMRDKLGPDAIFKVNRYTSLDDFLHGETADNSYVSAKQLAAQASAKALTAGPNLYKEIQAGGDTPITASIYNTLWKEAGGDSYDNVGKAQLHEAIMSGINSAAYKLELDDIEKQIQKNNQDRAWAQFRETQMMHDIELAEKGYKRDKDGNFIKIATQPELPEYDSSINRFFMSFAKDKSLAKDHLTKDGKLSPGAFNAEIFFNKEGKFYKPESSEIKGVGKVAGIVNRNKESIYDNIHNILINYGYNEEQISNMDKSTLEKALNDIANESTEAGRLTYRTSLDKNSTEFLFNKMQEMGYDFKSIEGFHKNKEGIYVPTIGGDAGITYADNSTGSILLDPSSKQFMLMYNGNYYNLPKDLISQDKANTLESVFGRRIDGNGEILPSEYEATNNYIQYIQNKRNKGEEITDREYKAYVAYLKKLQEMDSLMAEMGEKFVEYVGIKKTN